jgi:hypothetical protein
VRAWSAGSRGGGWRGPAAVDMGENFFGDYDGVLDSVNKCGAVAHGVRERGDFSGGEDAGGDEHGHFAAFVHGGRIAFSLFVRH